jgi:uncharacterized membrane protein YcaP (DUF421 family)
MDFSIVHSMFGMDIPVLEKIIRTLIIYGFLVIGLRLAGKRELAQLNPLDFIVLLMLSNAVQNAIIGNDNSVIGGLISGITLLGVNYLMVRYLFKHKELEGLLEGKPDVLVKNGHLLKKHLERELISVEDLEQAARKEGISSLTEIEMATLEPGGAITFVQKTPTTETLRHRELLGRLEHLEKRLLAVEKPMVISRRKTAPKK